jgi:uncharacterized protein YggT (Ycf19 family)
LNATAALLGPIIRVVLIVLDVINWTVLAWVILSWGAFFAAQTSFRWKYRTAYNILVQLNDIFSRMAHPFLRPFRRLLRRYDTAGIDWSPLLLWLSILVIRAIVEGIYGLILSR